MRYKKINYNGKELQRISAKKAMNILNHPRVFDGVTVYFLPVNANPESPFINGFESLTMDFYSMDAIDNMQFINEFIYYNCIDELGKYLKYYIEVSENA